ncbi:crotonase/enoyl-CoA hydratase family protein [Antrihabitans stalactiti]|uniref:Crotonase/enoyl-CoA hydratase family protein n=1 Tax=Antrihabitans stalactiti TaxID=2584121 RepID=A0A848KJW6_9NOCA|nr:crotonase/enoyl-CoA hydratase family protein [Antrihabitans stalactiti]NMN98401.1 crotonase/enoyl-CoA hydratase family protein [Antrihabitans stalactiti]
MSAVTTDAAPVVLEVDGPVLVITLNRPDSRNAVNSTVSTAIGTALERLEHDSSLRACVIEGVGSVFCAGADLKELAAGRPVLDPDHTEWGFAGLVRHAVSKPIIAAVNGAALGGGLEIVLACDLAIAAETATFALPEVRRGLVAAAGGLLRLHRQVPPKVAAHALLTGDPFDAATALQWGLVNAVVPEVKLRESALSLAHRIAANAPQAVRVSKRVMQRAADFGSDWSFPIWEMNETEVRAVRNSRDAREGARAFAEKRSPRWQD